MPGTAVARSTIASAAAASENAWRRSRPRASQAMAAAMMPIQPLLVPERARPATQTRSAASAASRTGALLVRDWTSHIRKTMAGRMMLANNAGSWPEKATARSR